MYGPYGRHLMVTVTVPSSNSFEARLYGDNNRTTGARIAVNTDTVLSPTGIGCIANKAPRPLLNDSPDDGDHDDDSDEVQIPKGMLELRLNVLVFILCGLADALVSVWSSLKAI
jgi:hypothetical protein